MDPNGTNSRKLPEDKSLVTRSMPGTAAVPQDPTVRRASDKKVTLMVDKIADLASAPQKQPINIVTNETDESKTSSVSCVSIYRHPSRVDSNTEMLPRHMMSDSSSLRPLSSVVISESEIESSTLLPIGEQAPNNLVTSVSDYDSPGASSSAYSAFTEQESVSRPATDGVSSFRGGTSVQGTSTISSVASVPSSEASSVQEVPSTSRAPSGLFEDDSESGFGSGRSRLVRSSSSEPGRPIRRPVSAGPELTRNRGLNSDNEDSVQSSGTEIRRSIARSRIALPVVFVAKPRSKFDVDSPMDPSWKNVSIPHHTLRHSALRKKSRHRIIFDSIQEETEEDSNTPSSGGPTSSRSTGSEMQPASMDPQTWEQYRGRKNILSAPLSGILYGTGVVESVTTNPISQSSQSERVLSVVTTTTDNRTPTPSSSRSSNPGSTRSPKPGVQIPGSKETDQIPSDPVSSSVTKIRSGTMTNRRRGAGISNAQLKMDICKAIKNCGTMREFLYLSRVYADLGGEDDEEEQKKLEQVNVLFASGSPVRNRAESAVDEDTARQGAELSAFVQSSEDPERPELADKTFDSDMMRDILGNYNDRTQQLVIPEVRVDEVDKAYQSLQPFVAGYDGSQPSQFTENTVKFHPYFRRHKAIVEASEKAGTSGGFKSRTLKTQKLPPSRKNQESLAGYDPNMSEIAELSMTQSKPKSPAPRLSYGRPSRNGIGNRSNTPMVKLNKIPLEFGVECEILLKCEYMNSTGIPSYRIISELLEHNENINVIDKEFTIVAPTNIGIGHAIAASCAERGYQPPIIILSDNDVCISDVNLLLSLGAKVVRCPTDKTGVTPKDKAEEICEKLLEFRSKTWKLDFDNELKNSFKHFYSSGREILEQCKKRADLLICDGDSALLLHEVADEMTGSNGKCKIVGVETDPFVRRGSQVKSWYPYLEIEAFVMARKLIRDEGILCGAIGGALVDCALKAAFDFNIQKKKDARIVILFPGGFAQGGQQFLNDQWMIDRNCWLDSDMECFHYWYLFIVGIVGYCWYIFHYYHSSFHYWWWDLPISIIKIKEAVTVQPNLSVRKALYILETCEVNRLVIVAESDDNPRPTPMGVLTKGAIMDYLKEQENMLTTVGGSWTDRSVDLDNILLSDIPCDQNLLTATVFMKLKDVANAFKTYHFLVVVQNEDALFYKSNLLSTGQLQKVVGVVSPLDVLQYKKSIMEDHRKRFGTILKG